MFTKCDLPSDTSPEFPLDFLGDKKEHHVIYYGKFSPIFQILQGPSSTFLVPKYEGPLSQGRIEFELERLVDLVNHKYYVARDDNKITLYQNDSYYGSVIFLSKKKE